MDRFGQWQRAIARLIRFYPICPGRNQIQIEIIQLPPESPRISSKGAEGEEDGIRLVGSAKLLHKPSLPLSTQGEAEAALHWRPQTQSVATASGRIGTHNFPQHFPSKAESVSSTAVQHIRAPAEKGILINHLSSKQFYHHWTEIRGPNSIASRKSSQKSSQPQFEKETCNNF